MKIVINKIDSIVGVDGRFYSIDLHNIPENIRVVHFDGTHGHIEYTDKENEDIVDFQPYQPYVVEWNIKDLDRINKESDPYYNLSLEQSIEKKLSQIDKQFDLKLTETFSFKGNNYYPDVETILAYFTVLPYLPDDLIITWKTADKKNNSLENIYVNLTKSEFKELALTLFQRNSNVWYQKDAKKQIVKTITSKSQLSGI